MSYNELLPTLKELNRADKLRVMQFLLLELAREEGTLLNAGSSYPIWSPYDAVEAASSLLEALKTEDKHA